MKKILVVLLLVLPFVANAQWTTNGSNVYLTQTAGKIGIGTTNPSYKLEVAGTAMINDRFRITGTHTDLGGAIEITNPAKGQNLARYWKIFNMGGMYGNALRFMAYDENGYNGAQGGYSTTSLVLMDNGNVGIGAYTPNYKLEVAGTAMVLDRFRIAGAHPSLGGAIEITNPAKGQNLARYWKIYNMGGEYGNSLQFWAYDENGYNGLQGGYANQRLVLMDNGNVGIGRANPQQKLEVAGNATVDGVFKAGEIQVKTDVWADHVFNDDYNLRSLNEVEEFIKTNKHLPDVPSTSQVMEEGINVAEMNAILLQKIEELTLLMIEQNKRIESLEKENQLLK